MLHVATELDQGTTKSYLASNRAEEKHLANRLLYHVYSVWLFTSSDLANIVLPETVFGICSALAAPVFELPNKPTLPSSAIWARAPLTAFWIWMNLLPLDIANQRQPSSVEEDRLNKPWRVIPSGRMSPSQAEMLMLGVYVITVLLSWRLGVFPQCFGLIVLGLWYNEFGGSDSGSITRNILNACAFTCFASGAMEVALDRTRPLDTNLGDSISYHNLQSYAYFPSKVLVKWLCLITMAISSSIHVQDLRDQAGDRLRGRHTVPLVIGDLAARWSIAIAVGFWSWACSYFWELYVSPYMMVVGALGIAVIGRTLRIRTVKGDKMTYMVWNGWIASLYVMPMVKRYAHFHD